MSEIWSVSHWQRAWSFDGKRAWSLVTATGTVKPLGLSAVCVEENFYRVIGADGEPHNRVELLFGVVDAELRRVQTLFDRLSDPDELEFDDLLGPAVTMAVQQMRTPQQRRLRLQQDAWLVAQNSAELQSINDPTDPSRLAGIHTELLFKSMWSAADVLSSGQIEIWEDPEGRFITSDAPVFTPFISRVRLPLYSAPDVLWPISPQRVVALAIEPSGEKAVIRRADGRMVGLVRDGAEQGRERMIFSSMELKDRLPKSKLFRRRTQVRIRCSHWTSEGEYVKPPGCCVELAEALDSGPNVVLCRSGLHRDSPEMQVHA